MFSWCKSESTRASSTKERSSHSRRPGRRRLMATTCEKPLGPTWRARYTSPIPPRPRRASSLKAPSSPKSSTLPIDGVWRSLVVRPPHGVSPSPRNVWVISAPDFGLKPELEDSSTGLSTTVPPHARGAVGLTERGVRAADLHRDSRGYFRRLDEEAHPALDGVIRPCRVGDDHLHRRHRERSDAVPEGLGPMEPFLLGQGRRLPRTNDVHLSIRSLGLEDQRERERPA